MGGVSCSLPKGEGELPHVGGAPLSPVAQRNIVTNAEEKRQKFALESR